MRASFRSVSEFIHASFAISYLKSLSNVYVLDAVQSCNSGFAEVFRDIS